MARGTVESEEEMKKMMEQAWKEAESIRKERRRRYGVAAIFTAVGVFLLFLSLLILFEGLHIWILNPFWSFVLLILLGSIAFGYGFYRMGVT